MSPTPSATWTKRSERTPVRQASQIPRENATASAWYAKWGSRAWPYTPADTITTSRKTRKTRPSPPPTRPKRETRRCRKARASRENSMPELGGVTFVGFGRSTRGLYLGGSVAGSEPRYEVGELERAELEGDCRMVANRGASAGCVTTRGACWRARLWSTASARTRSAPAVNLAARPSWTQVLSPSWTRHERLVIIVSHS